MDGWYCSEFHAQVVEQIYFSSAIELQIAQGTDGMVGWFAHALHSNTYLCKRSVGIFVHFHVSLDFDW